MQAEEVKMEDKVQISAVEWKNKFASKRDQFNFLTRDCKAWLSSYEDVTIFYCRDLISGKKKCKFTLLLITKLAVVKTDEAKVFFCPQYESLSMHLIYEKAREWPVVWEYLPDERDLDRLSRSYAISLIYTLVGQEFAD